MPSGAPPTEDNKAAYSSWCELVQKAIISALTTINEEFACRGVMAGTTVTVVVQVSHFHQTHEASFTSCMSTRQAYT